MEILKFDLEKENKIHLFLGISIGDEDDRYVIGVCLFRFTDKQILLAENAYRETREEIADLLFKILDYFEEVKLDVEYI